MENSTDLDSKEQIYTNSRNAVVGKALESRRRDNASMRRDLMKGISRHTEHYAYPHVISLASNRSEEDRLLRIAALVASSDIDNGTQSYGSWLQSIEGPSKDKSTMSRAEGQLHRMIRLPFELAVEELSRMLKFYGDKNGSFNWFEFADNLFFWGDGVSESSLKVRQRFLRDYYRTLTLPNPESATADKKDE